LVCRAALAWNINPNDQKVKVYPALLRWCKGYERYHGGRKKAPRLDHPDVKKWKVIALGALKRLVREFGLESQDELFRFIDWYWDAYVPRVASWLAATQGKEYSPTSPVNKSFRKAFEQWQQHRQPE